MDRREFLMASPPPKISNTQTARRGTATGVLPYSGGFGPAELTRLLKRTMFGASPADMAFFKGKSLSEVVDVLVNPTAALPNPPIKEYVTDGATVPDTGIPAGTTWVNDSNTDGTITARRRASIKKWWTGLMINQDRSIREKLTLFWHNHFATEFADTPDSQFLYKHHALLRASALGNFKTFVRAISVDPAMVYYLSGKDNSATAPNENYARELQELFTVGKENDPNYSEADVKAAARALTGWQVSSATIATTFNLGRHDKTAKVFSGFYGGRVIPARTAATSGDDDLDDLIDMIFLKKAEVSRFIVKKLYRWFCYYDIDASIEVNVIAPLAQIFVDSNWEIKPVLSALFKSEHFFDPGLQGSLIKSPVDACIGMCREFNIAFPTVTDNYDNAYGMFEYIRAQTATMSQSIGDPPDVAGWKAYYQTPQFHEIWLNADTLPKRFKFTDSFAGNGYTRSGFTIKIDSVNFTRTLSSPGNPNQLLIDAFGAMLQVPVSVTTRDLIKKQILLSGQVTDSYWTDAWNAYLANPLITGTPYKTVESRLKLLYKTIMNLPEYQLS